MLLPENVEAAESDGGAVCPCGERHPAAPAGLPEAHSSTVIGDEIGEVLWIPGHIAGRDRRRRILSKSEWCEWLSFMGLVKASRSYQYVWMHPVGDGCWNECRPGHPDCARRGFAGHCAPWTRIDLPFGGIYEA